MDSVLEQKLGSCVCLCGLHDFEPRCDGQAEVLVEMPPNEFARVVPMCGPCANRWASVRP